MNTKVLSTEFFHTLLLSIIFKNRITYKPLPFLKAQCMLSKVTKSPQNQFTKHIKFGYITNLTSPYRNGEHMTLSKFGLVGHHTPMITSHCVVIFPILHVRLICIAFSLFLVSIQKHSHFRRVFAVVYSGVKCE